MAFDNAHTQLMFGWLIFTVVSTMYLAPPVLVGLTADDLGESPGDVSLLPTANAFTQVLLSMPAGVFIHRVGVSRCISLGVAIFCLGATGCAFAASLPELMALQVAFGFAACLAGPGPLVLLLNTWFAEGKATAIGVMFTAFGVAGIFWPPILATVGEAAGWRAAYGLVALTAWLLALPIAVLLLHDGPHSGGRVHADLHPAALGPGLQPALEAKAVVVAAAAEGGAMAEAEEEAASTRARSAEVSGAAAAGRRGVAGNARCSCLSAIRDAVPWWAMEPRVWNVAAMSFWVLYVTQALLTMALLAMELLTMELLTIGTTSEKACTASTRRQPPPVATPHPSPALISGSRLTTSSRYISTAKLACRSL